MSDNQIKVRRKEMPVVSKPRWTKFAPAVAAIFFLGVLAAIAAVQFPDKFGFSAAPLEIVVEANRSIIRVPAGGDLQAAVNRAKSGDVIELQAGATYYGKINLPAKQIADFITIQSSAAKQLPENERVSPSQADLMAKIVTRGKGEPAISAENGAHHYRFVGIEFASGSADYIYNLILFGAGETHAADVPRDLEIDRCYLHPYKTGVTRRGVALNSANTIIKNSYFEGFAFPQEETQAIGGWTGTRNVTIINNYLEGGAENVLFGGSDPTSAELIPADIEVRANHFNKPVQWKDKNTIKNHFELKNAKRVQFVGNYLENCWDCAALTITVRNQDGKAPFSTIEDVLIKDNVVNGAGAGVNVLGKDDTFPSQTLKRLKVLNNVFLNIGEKDWRGSGYFVQISGGEDVLFANNIAFNVGNLTTFHGDLPKDFLFRDNVVGHGAYGIHGHENIKSLAGQRFFQNNVIVNNKGVSSGDTSFPNGNFWVSDFSAVGFVNLSQRNFRLAANSRFKGKGLNKTDIGANIESIAASLPKQLFSKTLQ